MALAGNSHRSVTHHPKASVVARPLQRVFRCGDRNALIARKARLEGHSVAAVAAVERRAAVERKRVAVELREEET
ncbi:MAG: hypothetical protein RL385_5380, partial [Pseudomonadota bacterium]